MNLKNHIIAWRFGFDWAKAEIKTGRRIFI